MAYTHYPQKLPKDIKDLQIDRLSGQELIDICSNPSSLYYTKKCENPTFWKDKILNDFPINNTEWQKPRKKTIRDLKTRKIIGKEDIIGTKYDIFNAVKSYDPFWIYKVLYYYFSNIENPEDERTNDIQDLLYSIYSKSDLLSNTQTSR